MCRTNTWCALENVPTLYWSESENVKRHAMLADVKVKASSNLVADHETEAQSPWLSL